MSRVPGIVNKIFSYIGKGYNVFYVGVFAYEASFYLLYYTERSVNFYIIEAEAQFMGTALSVLFCLWLRHRDRLMQVPKLDDRSDSANPAPPTAERLLSFLLPPERLEEAIGDFEEGYRLMLRRHGKGHASRWYYWQIFKIVLMGASEAALKAIRIWCR
ncbi:MAG: permease prefix domain 2-containing transporter [Stellaceae bacterium]